MSKYDAHISQAQHNLKFLIEVNQMEDEYLDWQVTIALYTALHLINAHVLATTGNFYQKHEDVHFYINPYTGSDAKLPHDIYNSYMKLFRLSRRSRYLCTDDKKATKTMNSIAHHIKPSHLASAFRNLDKLLVFFTKAHKLKLDVFEVYCDSLGNSENLQYFKKKEKEEIVQEANTK